MFSERPLTLTGRMIEFFFTLLLPLFLLLVLVWLLCRFTVRLVVLVLLWLTWSTRGISMLVVYSNSPHWQDYFEKGFLPIVGRKAKVVNWSDRSRWPLSSTFKVSVFGLFKGEKEYNPMILFFRPLHWPKIFRFYRPFHDARHGKTASLQKLESELSILIDETISLEHLYPKKSA